VGAGGIVGALAALGLVGSPRLARALAMGVLSFAVATIALGAAAHVALALALLAVTGVCNAMVDVAAVTLLQRLVPASHLGRVLGVVEGMWWATIGVGGFVASLLAGAFGVEVALTVAGVALLTVALALHRSMRLVDAAGAVRPEVVEALLGDRIFGALPTLALERVASQAGTVAVAAGAGIIREGETGDRYYVITDGAVEVAAAGVQARLGPGEGFGEVALLRDAPRNATVTAVEATALVAVERSAFLGAVRGSRRSAEAASAVADERAGAR
jgi:hypothetical protein